MNTLRKVVEKLLKSAELDGYFTNHSLRRSGTTRLFQVGVERKLSRNILGTLVMLLINIRLHLLIKERLSEIIGGEVRVMYPLFQQMSPKKPCCNSLKLM